MASVLTVLISSHKFQIEVNILEYVARELLFQQ